MMTPGSEAELAEAIAGASGPLCIQGGGTRGLAVEGDMLSTAGLSGVELYEPGALTLVVRAGTPVAEVEALLATENQRLAFEPMDHRGLLGTDGEPTIGGVIERLVTKGLVERVVNPRDRRARELRLTTNAPIDPAQVLVRLRQRYRTALLFAVAPMAAQACLGRSRRCRSVAKVIMKMHTNVTGSHSREFLK